MSGDTPEHPKIDLAFAYTIVYTLGMAKRKLTTRIIGMREFRQNFSKLIEEARKKNIHFVVMRHSKIMINVTPPTKKDLALEDLASEIAEAREEMRRGETYSLEEVAKELDIEL